MTTIQNYSPIEYVGVLDILGKGACRTIFEGYQPDSYEQKMDLIDFGAMLRHLAHDASARLEIGKSVGSTMDEQELSECLHLMSEYMGILSGTLYGDSRVNEDVAKGLWDDFLVSVLVIRSLRDAIAKQNAIGSGDISESSEFRDEIEFRRAILDNSDEPADLYGDEDGSDFSAQ